MKMSLFQNISVGHLSHSNNKMTNNLLLILEISISFTLSDSL